MWIKGNYFEILEKDNNNYFIYNNKKFKLKGNNNSFSLQENDIDKLKEEWTIIESDDDFDLTKEDFEIIDSIDNLYLAAEGVYDPIGSWYECNLIFADDNKITYTDNCFKLPINNDGDLFEEFRSYVYDLDQEYFYTESNEAKKSANEFLIDKLKENFM